MMMVMMIIVPGIFSKHYLPTEYIPVGIRSVGILCAHHVGDDDNDGGDDEDVDAGLAMLWRRKLGSRHPGHTGQRCLHHIVRDAYTLYCAQYTLQEISRL